MADRGMLARMIAGLIGPGAKPPEANFGPNPFSVPFTGLRNEPAPMAMPAFEQPGAMAAQYMPPMQMPQQAPAPQMAAPPQPTAPPPVMSGGQGFAGVEPPPMQQPAPMQAAYDPNTDPRYLPEQWRGAFNFPIG